MNKEITVVVIHVYTETVRIQQDDIIVLVQRNILVKIVNKEITVIAILVGMESVRIQRRDIIVLVRQNISEKPVTL